MTDIECALILIEQHVESFNSLATDLHEVLEENQNVDIGNGDHSFTEEQFNIVRAIEISLKIVHESYLKLKRTR